MTRFFNTLTRKSTLRGAFSLALRASEVAFVNSYKNPSAPPETGDDFNILFYSSALVVSAAALVVLLLAYRKRRYEE